jgi:hypothetical protein
MTEHTESFDDEFRRLCREWGYRAELIARVGAKLAPVQARAYSETPDVDPSALPGVAISILAGEVEKDLDAMRKEQGELCRRLDELAGDGK